MRPSFNIAGPCFPGEHYMLPPERRLGRVIRLIDDHKFFTLHAGRQTGKTTSAQWLVDHLNASGRFHAVWRRHSERARAAGPGDRLCGVALRPRFLDSTRHSNPRPAGG